MNKESNYNHIFSVGEKKYIYNSYTKASICINSDDFCLEKTDKMNEEEKKFLIKQGFILGENDNEYESLKYMFTNNYFNDNAFLNIVLVPGLDCNFKCPYCFEKVSGNKTLFETNQERYFSTLKKFSKKIFGKYENVEISLFGGEPLLFAEGILDYFDFIHKEMTNLSYFSSIVTNGALLDEEKMEKLLENNCKSVQITIDGWKLSHNKTRIFKDGKESYDLLIDNINKIVPLLPEDCLFNLRINLNNVSADEVKKTLMDIDESNRKKIKVLFRPIYNTDNYQKLNSNTVDNLKPYFDMAAKLGFNIVKNTYYYQACESCSGDNFYFIMPDLTIWKCINDINFKDAQIGRITDEGELEFDAEKIIKWYKYSNCFEDVECQKCKLLPDCYGGCVLYRAKNGKRSCKEFEMAALPYLY